jgi:hypothetical protein
MVRRAYYSVRVDDNSAMNTVGIVSYNSISAAEQSVETIKVDRVTFQLLRSGDVRKEEETTNT